MTDETVPATAPMFPAFEAYAEHNLRGKVSGALSAKLPRILGQGRTRAEGLDLPPAPIERRQTLAGLDLPSVYRLPPEVEAEIRAAKREVDRELEEMKRPDASKRLAVSVIRQLQVALGTDAAGQKDGQYFAGRFVLVSDKAGANWSWSLTKHYPIISRIPPDADYLVRAHAAAEAAVQALVLAPDVFEQRLALSHAMARVFSAGEDVLIQDVARMYKIAGQSEKFLNNPAKKHFEDVPDGALVANISAWRRSRPDSGFNFVAATLNQSMGANAKAFYLPMNPEGTMTRPVIYLRRETTRAPRA
ncbi:hypothetical protein [Mesorhizobium sp. CO1-1-8]|uniref:hypothetical protein n=1 Tax=Mesorhizobium sp. CO1-1-8 TaxID=2876631 RepID=UPI001CD0AB0C|nr:hypothetical protein [Mesorhizobium sp. CO1-1-8]MBZ9774013.1 hypothetical protein [Mesorhizobium sp. CO1-1-8]